MSTESHDEFLELCALSTSDHLTVAEREKLAQHLAVCGSCREAKKEFESLANRAIPAIAAAEHQNDADHDPSWSIEAAEDTFLRHLSLEEPRSDANPSEESLGTVPPSAMDTAWRHLWTVYAASILLVISLGMVAYRLGTHRASSLNQRSASTSVPEPQVAVSIKTLEEQLNDLSHEGQIARAEVAQRDRLIAELKHQLEQRSRELEQLKVGQETRSNAPAPKSGQEFEAERAQLEQRLEASEQQVNTLRAKLDSLEEQSSRQQTTLASFESKIGDLRQALEEKNGQLAQQQQLLAHDRDIRELMGARDLYISEVYDVARSGETQKAFGRVFYTKDKSLIFYAYDLNDEPGFKNASTFQAWGRRGPERSQALNLGIFYQDNAAKNRWVLKFNDAKTLAQIDAVFVTVEPEGGSRRPSGKPLLFAYLKMEPNHP